MKLKKILSSVLCVLTAALSCTSFGTVRADEENRGLRGDTNLDGKINVRDCMRIAKMLAMDKEDTLPENADYNLDKKINIKDASSLAKALTIDCVQTYDSRSVFSKVRCGMTYDEVMENLYIAPDYIYPNVINKRSKCCIFRKIDIPELDVDIKNDMHMSFNENNILYNYGYHIGRQSYSEKDIEYVCEPDELKKCYDDVLTLLTGMYGNGMDTRTGSYKTSGEHLWVNTDFGEVWMMYGNDLWYNNSGISEVLISCYDKKYAPAVTYPF